MNNPASPTLYVNANGVYYRKPPAALTIHGAISGSATPVPLTVTVKKPDGSLESTLANFFSAADASRLSALKMNDMGSQIFTTQNDLAEGEYTITVSGGGADPKTVTLVIDKTGPAITAVTPQAGGIITEGSDVQAALADISGIEESKAHYQKEGSSEASIDLPTTSPYKATLPTSLAEGKYEVWFTAKDKLGNETTSPRMTVWNDTAVPVLADIKVDGNTNTTVYSKAVMEKRRMQMA